ncbi:MAG: hypothetical protein DRJ03_24610 [Chloroflexi bacterium]|nr:MAG: hypothetical protein DRI81_12890 [Chloroflexota bacterium]RLC78824.1 MAG: hypothetical protein DRJ03_24610 [Chloroflexota bacterium]
MSTHSTLEITGFEELLRDLGRMTDLRDRAYWPLHDAMAQSLQLIEGQMKENLTRNDSVASGNLRAGVQSVPPRITETEIVGEVGPDQPYAPYVEEGTKPHTPPLEPLVEWVRLKHLAGTYSLRGRRRGSKARQQAGIERWTWRTKRDELVCLYCGPLNGKTVEIGKPFTTFQGVPITEPPLHPNCRCGVSPVGVRRPQDERSPAQDTIVLAGRERKVRMVQHGQGRVVVPIDLDTSRQVMDEQGARAVLDAQARLPMHLRNVVREVRLTDERDPMLERAIAERYGVPISESRVTASLRPESGIITIYENGDLVNDPGWPGALNDGAHEIGHRVAERLWGQRSPIDSEAWREAILADSGFPSYQAERGQDEDWAATFALWSTDPQEAWRRFPHRLALLVRWIEGK